MSEAQSEHPEGRKGRGNIIMTYEAVSELRDGVLEVKNDVKHLVASADKEAARTDNHEKRLRELEITVASLSAKQGSGVSVLVWAVGFVLASASILLNVMNYLK